MWVHKKNPISSPNQTPLNKQKCIPWLIIKKLDRCSFSALKLASPATVPLIFLFFLYLSLFNIVHVSFPASCFTHQLIFLAFCFCFMF